MFAERAWVLDRYPGLLQPTGPVEDLGNAGGLSGSRLWRYRSQFGPLLLRAWPPDGPGRATLERTHGWLSEVADLGFVPVPLPAREGRTLVEHGGRLWELTPWLPGAPSAPTEGSVRSAFGALARFHAKLARHGTVGPSPGLAQRTRELADWFETGLATLRGVLSTWPPGEVVDQARHWAGLVSTAGPAVLERLRRAAAVIVPLQPCLRDARPEHFLFVDGSVRGLVDFGAMGVDAVAGDLARLASEWFGSDPVWRAAGLESYEQVRPFTPAESGLIAVFEAAADLLIGGHWCRWHFLERRKFDDPDAVARGVARGLERAARRALTGG